MKSQKTILIYEMKKEKEKKILELCGKKQITVRTVHLSEYGQSLGSLAKISGILKNRDERRKDIARRRDDGFLRNGWKRDRFIFRGL